MSISKRFCETRLQDLPSPVSTRTNFTQPLRHECALRSIVVHLFEADDCDGCAGDHDEDAEDEEEVQDLVAEGAVGEAPVRHL